MKTIKFTTLAAGIVASLMLVSCSKNRTCTCTTTSTSTQAGSTVQPSGSTVTDLTKVNKKAADAICVSSSDVISYPATTNNNAYTVTNTQTCTLK
jgi:hypothetical protein